MSMQGGQYLIVGCGDIGRRVTALLLEQGASVTGVVRSEESAKKMREAGGEAIIAELNFAEGLAALPVKGRTVFYFAPPPGGGNTDPKVRNFCAAIAPGAEPEMVVYISTSGIYGDCGGAVVTEETPPNPQSARSRRRLDAETVLRTWGRERGVKTVILRVTGIYGPGRLPVGHLKGGHPLLRIEESPPTNRIHADDLAQVCVAAAAKGEDGDVFNVSDGHPSTMTEYFLAIAEEFGLPRPPLVTMEEARAVMTPLMLSYLSESRRMDNSKMLQKLGVVLRYPSFAQGLKPSADGQRAMMSGQAASR